MFDRICWIQSWTLNHVKRQLLMNAADPWIIALNCRWLRACIVCIAYVYKAIENWIFWTWCFCWCWCWYWWCCLIWINSGWQNLPERRLPKSLDWVENLKPYITYYLMYHTYSKNWEHCDWVIVFLVISEVGRPDYIAKSAIFKIWVLWMISLHCITLFVIDIHNIRCLEPFLPLHDHFEIRRFWESTVLRYFVAILEFVTISNVL